ncbi:30S ribosomal protein S4 [candidate division Kazan bacterium]|uniref:Small ribosomal subunit protein uS4 n=1 Tax=candidate division Kazan bacterium TaxID=2202143 RepID=A0A420ZDR7_UNCK3|nr:MAG: 30S ribosomal protein S4 [candidate division Kazan bacterium]
MKQVRALGEEFAVSGDRALASKYAKLHRKQPPGMHGYKKVFSKLTGYGQQLREKQKARVFYHLVERQLRKYYDRAANSSISTDVALLVTLERRLDNVIYRAGFTDSHIAARQLISHGHFMLNGRRVNIPSILVKAGDVVAIAGRSQALTKHLQDTASGNKPVSWLKVDVKKMSIEVVSLPTRDEIEVPFNEKLIVEFYSK